jgi:hypothetical protein
MSGASRPAVAAAIRDRLEAHLAPGFVGITDPRVMAGAGGVWTAAQIELWRDGELAWLDRALLEAPRSLAADRVARIGLALADTRVRDVTLVLAVRAERTAAVATALRPVANRLPAAWAAPTGTVTALCEWINGRDPIRVLDRSAPARSYPLADLARGTHAAGGTADQVCQWLRTGTLDGYRYGDQHRAAARAGERDEVVVLGEALNRAGWAVDVTVVDPDVGMLVGYLMREHTRVAVVQARVTLDADGDVVTGTGTLDFAADLAPAAAWRAMVARAGVSDGSAVQALLAARGLDLTCPAAAARVATSPTVMARTDQLLSAVTRGPRLT